MLKSRGHCQTWRVLAHVQMLNVMLSKKPLLVLEQWHDIMEAVSREDESGIDVPEDLERETLELIAVCSQG